MTLVACVPKDIKIVILLSNVHRDTAIDKGDDKKKPEIFKYYTITKWVYT